MQNTPKHAVPLKDVPFPELMPFWGPFLMGQCLTMGMLPLEHLLIVIVDA